MIFFKYSLQLTWLFIEERLSLNGFDASKIWQCVPGHRRLALASFRLPFESFESLLQCWWLVDPASLSVCWLLPVWFLKLWERNHFLGARKNGSGVKNTCFCRGPRLGSQHPYTGSQPLETPVLGIWCLLLTPMDTNHVYGTHTYMQAMALIHVK